MNDSTKNILIVTHHFPPHITGVGMVAYNQAKRLVRLGHKVTIVTSETNASEKSTTIDGIQVIRVRALNVSEKWGAPFPLFSPRLISVLRQEVKKADIVHIHDAFYMSSFFAACFARRYKKVLVLTEHIAMITHPNPIVIWIEKMVYATTGKMIFKVSDIIMVYNRSVKDFLINRGVPAQKIIMLMNGVDRAMFHPVDIDTKRRLKKKFGLSLDKKVFLFVGRFVHKKGFTKVLAAESSKYQIAFAGADPIQDSTYNLVFLGKRLPSEMAEIYQAADVFILPSESEGFPLSIQEAMACGLPIITTDDEGYDEYALDRKKVYLIQHPTNESVAEAINTVVNDDRLLEAMGQYSQKYIEENFDWDTIISKLEAIYKEKAQQKALSKKIAFVSDAIYQFNKGGKEKRLYDLTTQMAKDGYDVTIYCMKWWQGPSNLVQDGVKLCAISPYYELYSDNRRSLKQAIFFSLHCFTLLTKRFDIIDVDHIPHPVLFVTKFVCLLKRKVMIVTWHEVWGKQYWREYLGLLAGSVAYWVEKMSVMLPDKIVSVSDYTTAQLRSVLGVKKEIITIPNALDIEAIQAVTPGSPSDIIFAGRLLPHKNVDILLRAIVLLVKQHPTLKAYIVGDGPQKQFLEDLTKKLAIESFVVFSGFLEKQEDLYALMKSSKVFVLPSDREGFGITVIEANAAGLPVVTVNAPHNAAKDLIVDNKNGMVCDMNPQALADTIEVVLRSRQEAAYYRHFTDAYSWKTVFTQLKKLYI